tara:strand:+ start:45 stop:368 length:324 start_codon:yes stop_codon:yes gene_type:complete
MAYKMKGSEYFGKGEKSPFKVSDEALVAAQDELHHTELDWKEPGWAKAAKTVFAPPHEKMGGAAKGGGGGGAKAADTAKASKSVSDIASKNELKVDEDLMAGPPPIR